MVMPGFKAFDVKCLSCDWKDMIVVRSFEIPFAFLYKLQLPFKCPKCGGKLSKKENKTVKF